MIESIDTNDAFPDRDIPDGVYAFKVTSVRKKTKGNKTFYIWALEYDGVKAEQVMFANQMKGLLKVLGCTETTPGHFEWDPDLMEGKEFIATVKHVADKKDPSKIYQNMVDFKEADTVPF